MRCMRWSVTRSLLAVKKDATVPGLPAGNGLFVQQPLGLVGKLVRPEGADRLEPGLVALQRRMRQLLGQYGVVDPVQFQREEQGFH